MAAAARILFQEYGTILRVEPDDSLLLDVLCGGIGQYGVEFRLNSSEQENYKRQGDEYIQELAWRVRRNPRAYIECGRTY